MATDKETVREFMKSANRPFSGNDVFSRLQRHGVGKSAVDKALDQLVRENELYVKVYGKQRVYCAVQPDDGAGADAGAEAAADAELAAVEAAVRDAERRYRQSEAELRSVRAERTVDELRRDVAGLEKAVAACRARLDGLVRERKAAAAAGAGAEAASPAAKELAKKDYERVAREYRKRKRACTDILDSILENCPKTKKALFEEIGVETDEAAGMPALP